MVIIHLCRTSTHLARRAAWSLLVTLSAMGIAQPTAATPIPAAATQSKLTITAQLQSGNDSGFLGFTDAAATTTASASTTSVSTTIRALQESLNLQERAANAISLHTGHAEAGTSVVLKGADANLQSVQDPTTIAVFDLAHHTRAEADTPEPLFSRSVAASQTDVLAVFPRNNPVPASTGASLDLVWNVDDLFLRTVPTNSFAYLRDTVSVFQSNGVQSQTNTVGLATYLQNGAETTRLYDLTGTTTLGDWFEANIERSDYAIQLREGSSPLTVSLPLLEGLGPTVQEQNLTLVIRNTHTEISYEAPPRATVQVAQLAGHAGNENILGTNIRWDAASGILSLETLPIDILSYGSANMDPHVDGNDALLGGYLEFDDLLYFADFDGRRYFSGNEFRMLDAFGNVLITAAMPTLVFEDSLFSYQGFNLFAPILNILGAEAGTSPWLDSFLDYITADSTYLPELFIGFDHTVLGDGLWEKSFDVSASAYLSFAGVPDTLSVPTSSTVSLLSIGLVIFLSFITSGNGLRCRPRRAVIF